MSRRSEAGRRKIAPLGAAPQRGIRRSALGALPAQSLTWILAAWWGEARGRDRLTWWDAGILTGLGLAWWLERQSKGK